MSTMRISPVVSGTRPELAELERRILKERGRMSTLYGVLLNCAPLAEGCEAMLTAIRNRASLPARLTALDCLVLDLTDAMTREIEVPDALFERLRARLWRAKAFSAAVQTG